MSMYGDNMKSHVYDDIRDMIRTGEIMFNDLFDIIKDIYENEIESESDINMLIKIEKMSELEAIFEEARKDHAQTIAVEITIPGQRDTEFIINQNRSFRNKLNYYKRTYNDDLVHNKVPSIKIVSAGFGDANLFD